MRRSKNLWLALIIFTYLLVTIPLLNAPLRWDETEWPAQANAILQRAVPKVLFSESHFIYHPQAWLTHYAADYGLWHPPLYLYSLAVFVGLLGNSVAAARLLGLFTGLLTLGAVIFAVRYLARERGWSDSAARRAAFISGMLTAVNPFYAHGALFVDIDNTLLLFLAVVYLLLVIFMEKFPTGKNVFLLGAVTLLLFWTKLTTPFILITAAVFYCIIRRRRDLLVKLSIATIAGIVFFIVSWFIYCRAFGVPVSFFLDFTYFGRTSEFFVFKLYNILSATRFNTVMISLPLVALGFLFFIRRFMAWKKTGFRAETQDIFWLTAGVLFLFYSLFWTNFGKYTVVVVPLLAIPVGLGMAEIFNCRENKIFIRFWLGIGLAALLYYWLIVPDIITGPFPKPGVTGIATAMADPRVLRYCLAGVPILLAFCVFCFRRRQPGAVRSLAVSLLVVLFPANIVQNVSMYPACLESSILTPSKARGFMDAVRFVNEVLTSSDRVLAPKEFAYYLARGKVIPMDREIAYPDKFLPAAIMEGSPAPEYAIFYDKRYGFFASSGFNSRYQIIRKIGSYSIYKRRG